MYNIYLEDRYKEAKERYENEFTYEEFISEEEYIVEYLDRKENDY